MTKSLGKTNEICHTFWNWGCFLAFVMSYSSEITKMEPHTCRLGLSPSLSHRSVSSRSTIQNLRDQNPQRKIRPTGRWGREMKKRKKIKCERWENQQGWGRKKKKKIEHQRGRKRERKNKDNFINLGDDDVSKRSKFLNLKKWDKNHFELWNWDFHNIITTKSTLILHASFIF